MTRIAGSWAHVLSSFGSPRRPRRGPDGEQLWLGPWDWLSVDIWLPRTASFLLLCPKSQPVGWCLADKTLPRDVAIVCGPYPAERRALPLLEALFRRVSAAAFVGDLDPYSLVQYVETRRMLAAAKGPPLLYGGIDDAWLDAMERALRRRSRLVNVSIRLSKHEITLLKRLERSIDLEDLVGPKGSSLLRSGYKVELEGATNPRLYPSSHRRWVFRYLRSLALAHPAIAGH